jgi:transcriptional regulator with XRE-family HTH domain
MRLIGQAKWLKVVNGMQSATEALGCSIAACPAALGRPRRDLNTLLMTAAKRSRISGMDDEDPIHPGVALAEDFLPSLKAAGITQEKLAGLLGMSPQNLHLVLRGRRALTPTGGRTARPAARPRRGLGLPASPLGLRPGAEGARSVQRARRRARPAPAAVRGLSMAADDEPDVNVSEAMKRAGLEELREHRLGGDLGELAAAVYMAMEHQRRTES